MTTIYSRDIPDDFFPALRVVAERLQSDPEKMMRVMKSESDVRANAHNNNPKHLPPDKRYNASGLIQFMPFILPNVGWHGGHAAFRQLSATQQLPYVEQYYKAHVGHLGTIGGLYVATFLPALVKHAGDPSYVLTADPNPKTKGEPGERLGWAFEPNAGFDKNGDRAITVRELEDMVNLACTGARWQELLARLNGGEIESGERESEEIDLRTVLGMQRALAQLGHDPGTLDGWPGPKTTAAIVSFQRASSLVPDGIYGPLTRRALTEALEKAT